MTEIELPSDRRAAQRASFVSQTTVVEQSRAVAEVQAAVVVAQQVPRDLSAAVAAMRESCRQPGLADRAFFRFPRAGQTVSGPSVHLARELARCWGNVQYGIRELRRDDEGRYSEMLAWAWDVQTNTRSEHVFVVPHRKDTKTGVKDLVDLRDVYENNANQASRRLREAVFAILPAWFTEEAKARCTDTLRDGGEKSLAQQVADIVAAFDSLGVSLRRLEHRFGATAGWTPHDLAQLRVIGASIRQGTVTVDDEFPSTTNDDIAAQAAPTVPEPVPLRQQPVDVSDAVTVEYDPAEPSITAAQMSRLHARLREDYPDRDAGLAACSAVLGRQVASTKDLTVTEAAVVIDALEADRAAAEVDQSEGGAR